MAVPKQLELKILVDKERNKVLFAEAGSDFLDCLFSFLTLPFGTIVRLIGNQAQSQAIRVGCFNTLKESVLNLNTEHFYSNACKDMLLKPRCLLEEEFRKLKINVDDTQPPKYYVCSKCSQYKNKDWCNRCMLTPYETSLEDTISYRPGEQKEGVFVRKDSKFIITDDLLVIPHDLGTAIGHLYKLGIEDTNALEERTVALGLNQLLDLLKYTLVSTNPLTDLFLLKRKFPERLTSKLDQTLIKNHSFDPKNEYWEMTVKVRLRKTNKEVLFVEARQDFIDFLFSFLTIPLVELLHILDGQTSFGCLDGLYNSALALDSAYFKSYTYKSILSRPKCSPYVKRKKELFPSQTSHGSFSMERVMKSTET